MGVTLYAIKSKLPEIPSIYFRVLCSLAVFLFCLGAYFDIKNYIYAPVCFSVFIVALTGFSGGVHKFLINKYLIFLGEISYSIYMTHYFLRDFMTKAFLDNDEVAGFFWIVFYVSFTLIASAATYRWIEKPGQVGLNNYFYRKVKIISK